MLRRASTYNELRTGFIWSIPARYNIGTDVCDRHVSGNPLALIYLSEGAGARRFGFDDVRRWSNRFANALAALGLDRGDRIGVLLPQAPETALVRNSGGGRRAGRWTRFQAMRCDAGIPSRVIRFSTAQPTRASVFWAGSVRARRPRPMTVL